MNEFKLKWIYNGVDSFLDLDAIIINNTKANRAGNWKGIIKKDGKNFIRSEGTWIPNIIFKIIEELDEKKDILIEMDLYS